MIRVLTGPLHSGKTTRMKELVRELKASGIEADGFLSEAVTDGYDLFDLKNEKALPLLRKNGQEHWQRTGSWYVVPETLAEAERIIHRGAAAGLLVVDEIGPLEMKGNGFWPALENVMRSANSLLVVQERILEQFLEKVKTIRVDIYDNMSDLALSWLRKALLRRDDPNNA